jgi:orotate phosphoribosyltransferase
MPEDDVVAGVLALLPAHQGHFRLESNHHGALWLDLERLCFRPQPVRRLAVQLAARLAPHQVQMVCGPLVDGAFVALMVAEELGVPFIYAQQGPAPAPASGLYPLAYAIPPALRAEVPGKRVAIVNDVVNAGSAVRGTLVDLKACGGQPVVLGALAVLGLPAARLAAEASMALETLAALPGTIWTPAECPLCAQGIPLTAP